VQSLCKCIVPLSSHRANEWVLWNYPFDHHYYCPPKPPRGFRPSSPPPPAPPSASPAVLHPLAQPAVSPTMPLLMMQQSFKPLPSVKQSGKSSTPKQQQPALQNQVHVATQGTAFVTANAQVAPNRSAAAAAAAAASSQPAKEAKKKRSMFVVPHTCPCHTCCVEGKCPDCLCDKCKMTQVSGKRVAKQRTFD